MDLYNLEKKVDIVISMLNNNVGVISMAKCPYCESKKSISTNNSYELEMGSVLYSDISRNIFLNLLS